MDICYLNCYSFGHFRQWKDLVTSKLQIFRKFLEATINSGFSFWLWLSTPRQTCGLADCGSLAGQVPHYNWACAPQQPRQRQHQARPAPGCQPTCHLQEDIHTNITSDTHTHTHLHINTITQKRTKGQTHLQVFRCFWWTPRLLSPIGTCNIWQETLHL